MANNIKGITVEIGGNTGPRDKALKDINKTSRDLQSELREVNKQLKLDPTNTILLDQKQKLLAESVTNTKEKLETLKEAEKQVQEQFKQGKIGEEQYRALQREVIKTEQDLEKLEGKLKSSSSQLHAFGDRVEDAGEKLNHIGEGVKNTGEKMSIGLTGPIVAAGAVMVKGALDVESAQGRLQAALGLTKEEANKLEQSAKEVWESGFGENIGEATNAIVVVRQNMKGLAESELAEVTKGAMTIADVFGEDVNSVTATAGVMMKNFGIDGTHALDVITVGFQQGGNYSGELLDTMREYAPQFKSLGIEADQAMGMLIAGVEAGSFNLDKVGDAMKEFNIRAQDGSKTTAQGFEVIGLNADKMGEAIAQGGDKAQGAFMATVTALANMKDPLAQNQAGVALFGTQWEDVRSKVIIAMKDGMNGIGEFTGETKAATDALSKSNPGMALQASLRQLQASAIPLIQPIINFINSSLIPAIQSIAKGFSNLSPGVQQFIITILGMSAALGPALIVLGTLIKSIGNITEGFGEFAEFLGKKEIGIKISEIFKIPTMPANLFTGLKAGLESAGAAVSKFMFGPWKLLSDGIKSLPGIIKNFSFGDIVTKIITPFKSIPTVISGVFSNIPGILNEVKTFFMTFGSTIIGLGPKILTAIRSAFSIQGIMTAARTALTLFTGPWGALALVIATVVGAVIANWGKIKAWVQQHFGGTLPQNFQQFKQSFEQIWNSIQQKFTNVWNSIKQVVTDVWNYISPTITGAVNEISSFWNEVWPQIKQVFVEVWDVMKVILAPAMAVIYTAIEAGIGLIKGIWGPAWNLIKDTLKIVWDGIAGIIRIAWDVVSGVIKVGLDLLTGNWSKAWSDLKSIFINVWADIKQLFSSMINDALSWGKDLVQGMINGIRGSIGGVADAAKDIATTIWEYLHHSVPEKGPLADDDTWMPDFVQGLAKGIDDNSVYLQNSALKLSSILADSVMPEREIRSTYFDYMAKGTMTVDRAMADLDGMIDKLKVSTGDYTTDSRNLLGVMTHLSTEINILTDNYNAMVASYGSNSKEAIDALNKLSSLRVEYQNTGKSLIELTNKVKDEQIKNIDDVTSKVKEALKEQYSDEQSYEEKRLNLELETKKKSLQTKIDSLDAQLNQHEIEVQDAEDTEKEKQLRQMLQMNYSKKKKEELQQELDDLLKAREERKYKESIEAQKTSLQNQITLAEENTNKQLQNIKDFYEAKLREASINAEAEQLIMNNNQDDMIKLLHDHGKDYELAGQDLGTRLVNGFKTPLESLRSIFNDLAKSLSNAQSSILTSSLSTSVASGSYSSNVSNTSTTTVKNSYGALFNAENVVLSTGNDIKNLAVELQYYINQVNKSKGGS